MRILFAFLALTTLLPCALAQQIRYLVPKDFKTGEEVVVSVTLPVKGIKGMARFQQEFPRGFEVNEMSSEGAIFTFSNTLLQFLWIQLPVKDSLTISYKLRCIAGYGGKAEVPGRLFYLRDNVREELKFASMQFSVSGEASKRFTAVKPSEVAAESPASRNKPTAPVSAASTKSAPAAKPANTESSAKANPPSKAPASSTKKETSPEKKAIVEKKAPEKTESAAIHEKKPVSPTPETPKNSAGEKIENKPQGQGGNTKPSTSGITFRIQLAASADQTDKAQLATRFSLAADAIREEQHNGMYKYTVGDYPSLADARKVLSTNPSLKNGAFIAGYQAGQRIDLEEAIRLSKR